MQIMKLHKSTDYQTNKQNYRKTKIDYKPLKNLKFYANNETSPKKKTKLIHRLPSKQTKLEED